MPESGPYNRNIASSRDVTDSVDTSKQSSQSLKDSVSVRTTNRSGILGGFCITESRSLISGFIKVAHRRDTVTAISLVPIAERLFSEVSTVEILKVG